MKLEVGKQYKTRGGWRAVCVDGPDCLGNWMVWHSNRDYTIWHEKYGTSPEEPDYDLIAEWSEPRKGEFWVNIYPNGTLENISHQTKEAANDAARPLRLALKRVTWTEGDEE